MRLFWINLKQKFVKKILWTVHLKFLKWKEKDSKHLLFKLFTKNFSNIFSVLEDLWDCPVLHLTIKSLIFFCFFLAVFLREGNLWRRSSRRKRVFFSSFFVDIFSYFWALKKTRVIFQRFLSDFSKGMRPAKNWSTERPGPECDKKLQGHDPIPEKSTFFLIYGAGGGGARARHMSGGDSNRGRPSAMPEHADRWPSWPTVVKKSPSTNTASPTRSPKNRSLRPEVGLFNCGREIGRIFIFWYLLVV